MEIILSHISALEFWRSGNERVLQQPRRFCSFETAYGSGGRLREADIRSFQERGFDFFSERVHVLVPSADERSVTRGAVCHVCPKGLPPRSLVRIGEGAYVCRPELVYVQMACRDLFPNIVLRGLELCGAFRMSVGDRPVLFQRAPLATVASLSAYIEQCEGVFGATEAGRSLLYVANGSESPMEATLTIILCFPIRLGGYGLPMPVLNMRIPATDEIRNATGRSSFRCDLLWPEAGVAVEYDGRDHEERVASDTIRRTALVDLGIHTSIVVTMEQMKNEAQLDLVVKQLRRLLGVRSKRMTRDWSAQRRNLRTVLGLEQ